MITAAKPTGRRAQSRETKPSDRQQRSGDSVGPGSVIIRPGMMIRDWRDNAVGTVVECYDDLCVYVVNGGRRVQAEWGHVSACAVQPELPDGYVMNLSEATADPYYRMSNELLVFMNRVERRLGRSNGRSEIPLVIEHLEAAFGVLMNLSNDYRQPWIAGDLFDPSMDAKDDDDAAK